MDYPTLKTLTVLDIAKLGVYADEYSEKFRGTIYYGTIDELAYHAAYRVIGKHQKAGDEELVLSHYEASVRSECFTQKGHLSAFYKRGVYTPRHIRDNEYSETVKRMQERKDRKIFEALKKKYGWT